MHHQYLTYHNVIVWPPNDALASRILKDKTQIAVLTDFKFQLSNYFKCKSNSSIQKDKMQIPYSSLINICVFYTGLPILFPLLFTKSTVKQSQHAPK